PLTTTYTYDSNGNRLSMTDSRGTYDLSGNPALTTYADQFKTSYAYDELNRQTTVTMPDPDGPSGTAGPGGQNLSRPVMNSKYDGFSDLVESRDLRGTSFSNSPGANLVTTFVYDQRGRLTTKSVNSTGPAA